MSVTITPDLTRWDAAIAVLGSDLAAKGFVRGINRTASNSNAAMTKVIADDMGLQQKGVRDELRIEKATDDSLTARVYATSKQVPLIYFGARGKEPSAGRGRGVTANLKSGAGRYPNAFIATVTGPKGGRHRGVFSRKADLVRKSAGARGMNLPIYELHGPSIAKVYTKYEHVARDRATEMLIPNVQHEIEFLLKKAQQ